MKGDAVTSASHDAASKLRLTVGYDGTEFIGSQRQANGRTVQEELERALECLGGKPVTTEFAGRTDRGVHAIGQVVACADIRPAMPGEAIQRALNHLLSPHLTILELRRTGLAFHPRYDATWREYRYRIWVGLPQPIVARQVWHRRDGLDPEAMDAAARRLVGTHDLASFTGGGEGVPWSDRASARRGTIRTIFHSGIRRVDGWWGVAPGAGYGIEYRIVADGFLPQLVRTVVGGLVTIGAGKRPAEWFDQLLIRTDRRAGPAVAPANGLVLWRVGYGDDVPDPDPNGDSTVGNAPPHMHHG